MNDNLKELKEALDSKLLNLKHDHLFLLTALGSYLAAVQQENPKVAVEVLMQQCGLSFSNFRIELDSVISQLDSLE